MLSTAARKATTHTDERRRRHKKSRFASRKIWLPRLIYDALPYFYLASGLVAFFATLYVTDWFWVLPHYALFSFLCFHLGVIVYRRRHAKSCEQADSTE